LSIPYAPYPAPSGRCYNFRASKMLNVLLHHIGYLIKDQFVEFPQTETETVQAEILPAR
jgi:hypothetical protein